MNNERGEVIGKKSNDAYTTLKHHNKFQTIQYYPRTYSLKIQKEINGEIKSIWVDVDETTYNEFNIGDSYPGGKN